jgi:hypothetical protein
MTIFDREGDFPGADRQIILKPRAPAQENEGCRELIWSVRAVFAV